MTALMKQSLVGTNLSPRLQNILIGMASYRGTESLDIDELAGAYFIDPPAVAEKFLRMPGAGKKTWDELKDYFHTVANEQKVGGASFINREDCLTYSRAIDDALHSISSSSSLYVRLRALQEHLRSATIYIQKPNDKRPIFPSEDNTE